MLNSQMLGEDHRLMLSITASKAVDPLAVVDEILVDGLVVYLVDLSIGVNLKPHRLSSYERGTCCFSASQ